MNIKLELTAPRAIVLAAIIVAALILITNHWQIGVAPGPLVYRLDRWTGAVVFCNTQRSEGSNTAIAYLPANINCEP